MNIKTIGKKKAGIIALTLVVLSGTMIMLSTTIRADPPVPPGEVLAFQGNVTVSLSAYDAGSGVDFTSIAVYYRAAAQNEWTVLLPATNYTGNITYSQQGWYQVHYFSQDKAGNLEVEKHQDFVLWQDMAPPTTTITITGTQIWPW